MTLDDAREYGRLAFLPLSSGALLRYHPEDGAVRILSYPNKPDQWDRLPILDENIPREGWKHAPSCGCSRCRPDGSDVG